MMTQEKELIEMAANLLEKTSIGSGRDLLMRYKPRSKKWVLTFDKHTKAYGSTLLGAMESLMKVIIDKK